jgi:hypothetical protein
VTLNANQCTYGVYVSAFPNFKESRQATNLTLYTYSYSTATSYQHQITNYTAKEYPIYMVEMKQERVVPFIIPAVAPSPSIWPSLYRLTQPADAGCVQKCMNTYTIQHTNTIKNNLIYITNTYRSRTHIQKKYIRVRRGQLPSA